MKRNNIIGWIGMEKVKEIIRLKEAGYSKQQIAISCKVSRPTVRDYILKANASRLSYKEVVELKEDELIKIFSQGKAGRKREEAIDFEKMSQELHKKGVTKQLLWQEYLRENPQGVGYSNFCKRLKEWKTRQEPTMRQVYKAGEKLFVDYSGMKVVIEGEVITEAEIFVGVLGASNKIYCEATLDQRSESWLNSHVRMFNYYGGVPEIVVPDNLKSGVEKANWYEPGINRSYNELAEHYGVAIIPTRSKHPRDKAKVEQAVQQVQREILAVLRNETFRSVEEVNLAIKPLLEVVNAKRMQVYGKSRNELFEELEREELKPLPSYPYELSLWKTAKVNIDYHIEFERHYYSVPHSLVGESVELKCKEKIVEIYHNNTLIAVHSRDRTAGKHTTKKEHMPQSHEFMSSWSAERLINWGKKVGPQTTKQIELKISSKSHPEQSYRSCLGLLSMAKKYGNERIETVCAMVNVYGATPLGKIKRILEIHADKLAQHNVQRPAINHTNIRGDYH